MSTEFICIKFFFRFIFVVFSFRFLSSFETFFSDRYLSFISFSPFRAIFVRGERYTALLMISLRSVLQRICWLFVVILDVTMSKRYPWILLKCPWHKPILIEFSRKCHIRDIATRCAVIPIIQTPRKIPNDEMWEVADRDAAAARTTHNASTDRIDWINTYYPPCRTAWLRAPALWNAGRRQFCYHYNFPKLSTKWAGPDDIDAPQLLGYAILLCPLFD